MICPVCGEEGQQITVMAGNKSQVIVYHPRKVTKTVCNLAQEEATTTDQGQQA